MGEVALLTHVCLHGFVGEGFRERPIHIFAVMRFIPHVSILSHLQHKGLKMWRELALLSSFNYTQI